MTEQQINSNNRNELIKGGNSSTAVNLVSRGLDLIRKDRAKKILLPAKPIGEVGYYKFPEDILNRDNSSWVELGEATGEISVPEDAFVSIFMDDNKRYGLLKELKPGDVQFIHISVQPSTDPDELSFPLGLLELTLYCRDLKDYAGLSNEVVCRIANVTTLRSLSLPMSNLKEPGVQLLKPLASLERLHLYLNDDPNNCLSALASLRKLRDLHVYHFDFTNFPKLDHEGLEGIGRLNCLEHLKLEWMAISGSALKQLCNMPKLKVLDLSDTALEFTEEDADVFTNLKSVEQLFLRQTEGDEKAVEKISALPNLNTLDIEGYEITERAMKSLSTAPGLRCLRLGDPSIAEIRSWKEWQHRLKRPLPDVLPQPAQIGKTELHHLANMVGLRQLSIIETRIAADGMEALSKLPHLVELDLSSSEIESPGFEYIDRLQKLSKLSLANTKFGDQDAAWLPRLKHLRSLNIAGTDVTKEGIKHIALTASLEELNLSGLELDHSILNKLSELKQLSELELNDTNLTDSDIPALQTFKSLKWLWLSGTGITPGGIEEIKSHLSGCEVIS